MADFNKFAPNVGHPTGSPWPMPHAGIGPGTPVIPHWIDAEKPIVFQNAPLAAPYNNPVFGDTTGVAARALWASPILNFRPDVADANNYRPQATAVPGAARLHVQIRDLAGLFLSDLPSSLEVYSLESTAIIDPDRIRAIEERFDISSDFYAGTQSTLLEWAPPGAPIVFWRVHIIFDWMDVVAGAPNTLVAWASVH